MTSVVGITYIADAATELPVTWDKIMWLDDRNKRQHLSSIDFTSDKPFIMADGYKSMEVTG